MRLSLPTLSRREFLAMSGAAGAGMVVDRGTCATATPSTATAPARQPGQQRAFGLRCPPLSKVRIGFIGMGGRGMSLLGNLLDLDRVEIRAVCDIVPDRVQRAQERVLARGQPEPAGYAKDEVDFEKLCGREDLDLIYIATPWDWHVPMALTAASTSSVAPGARSPIIHPGCISRGRQKIGSPTSSRSTIAMAIRSGNNSTPRPANPVVTAAWITS